MQDHVDSMECRADLHRTGGYSPGGHSVDQRENDDVTKSNVQDIVKVLRW